MQFYIHSIPFHPPKKPLKSLPEISVLFFPKERIRRSDFGTKSRPVRLVWDFTPVKERTSLTMARKIRNELIHGLNMASISTLQIKKLCGVTSRILMYKLMNELREE